MAGCEGILDLTKIDGCLYTARLNAGITQLVEYQLPKLRVAGSNPVSRSNKNKGL